MDLIYLCSLPLSFIELPQHVNQSGKLRRTLVAIAASRQYHCYYNPKDSVRRIFFMVTFGGEMNYFTSVAYLS